MSTLWLGLAIVGTGILVLGLLAATITALYYVVVVKIMSLFLKKETTEIAKTVFNKRSKR